MMAAEPEPSDTGNVGDQVVGQPSVELIPADKNNVTGLTPTSAFLEELHTVLPVRDTFRRAMAVVGRAQDRILCDSQEQARVLRDDLEKERVAHARTDERLQHMKGQNAAQILLQALGGVAIGWAGGKFLDGQPSLTAAVVTVVGFLFLAFGSWPVLRARRGRV